MHVEQREDGKWYVVDAQGNTVGIGWASETLANRALKQLGGTPAAAPASAPAAAPPGGGAQPTGAPGAVGQTIAALGEAARNVLALPGALTEGTQQALAEAGLGPKLTPAKIINGATEKGGNLWTPEQAYLALVAFKGYSPGEAASELRLSGIDFTPPAAGDTAARGAGGTGGNGGSQAKTREQLQAEAAAEFDAAVAEANAAIADFEARTGVRVFRGERPGTGFYYDAEGRIVPVAYSAQRGRVEAGTPQSGTRVVRGPDGATFAVNPARARAIEKSARFEDGRRVTSVSDLSAAEAARFQALRPAARAAALRDELGLDRTPTLAEESAILGGADVYRGRSRAGSVAGPGHNLMDEVLTGVSPAEQYQRVYQSLIDGGATPAEADYRARLQVELSRIATSGARAAAEELVANLRGRGEFAQIGDNNRVMNEFGQILTPEGPSRGESGIAGSAADRGYRIVPLAALAPKQFVESSRELYERPVPQPMGGFAILDPSGEVAMSGLASLAEAQRRADLLAFQERQRTAEERARMMAGGATAAVRELYSNPVPVTPGVVQPEFTGDFGLAVPRPQTPRRDRVTPRPQPAPELPGPAPEPPVITPEPEPEPEPMRSYRVFGFNRGGQVVGRRPIYFNQGGSVLGSLYGDGMGSGRTMMVDEEVVGVGARTGRPLFVLNEGRDGLGGEVVPERLTIEPVQFNQGGTVQGYKPIAFGQRPAPAAGESQERPRRRVIDPRKALAIMAA